jgi:hypothetical protein
MGHASTTMLERIYGKPGPEELLRAMEGSIASRKAGLRLLKGGNSPRKPARNAG